MAESHSRPSAVLSFAQTDTVCGTATGFKLRSQELEGLDNDNKIVTLILLPLPPWSSDIELV